MPNRLKEPHAKDPRKLKSGRWQARVTYYDTETGKRHETSQTFATEREAKKWSREQESQYREDPNRKPPSEQTFEKFYQRWLDGVAATRTEDTTVKAYRRYAKPLIVAFGQKPLRAITPADFQDVFSDMLKDGKATSTIHHTYVVGHSSLKEAVNWGLIPFNPADRVRPPRVTSPEVVPPTPEVGRKLLDAVETHRLKALWWFISLVGCRKGEALALKWLDVDLESRTVSIRRNVAADGGLRSIHDTKTTKGRRSIALSEYLVSILTEHRQHQQIEHEFYGSDWNAEGWVFPSERGTLLWPSNVNRHFRLVLKQAGLPKAFKPHDLRHAMASAWIVKGVPVKVVSERLGHANINITLQIYGHLMPNMQAEAAKKMEELFMAPIPTSSPLTLKNNDIDEKNRRG